MCLRVPPRNRLRSTVRRLTFEFTTQLPDHRFCSDPYLTVDGAGRSAPQDALEGRECRLGAIGVHVEGSELVVMVQDFRPALGPSARGEPEYHPPRHPPAAPTPPHTNSAPRDRSDLGKRGALSAPPPERRNTSDCSFPALRVPHTRPGSLGPRSSRTRRDSGSRHRMSCSGRSLRGRSGVTRQDPNSGPRVRPLDHPSGPRGEQAG